MKKLKQVFSFGGSIIIEDIDAPLCDVNNILVRNGYSVISIGTEMTRVKKQQDATLIKRLLSKKYLKKGFNMVRNKGLSRTLRIVMDSTSPVLVPLGYSSAGIVIAVGKNITNFAVGDRVACAGGGYATHSEVVSIPKNLACKIPQKVSLRKAAFSTIGAIALQGIRRAELTLGECVLVIGVGLIGQITCQILSSMNIKVIAVDLSDRKLKIAKKNGADLCLRADQKNFDEKIMNFTHKNGVDAAIICASTSSNEPVNQAMRVCRKKGRVIVVGAVGMDLDRNLMYPKELDFKISTSYGPGRYDSKYEEDGIDYPIGYVRWTENRNMQTFLELIEKEQINLSDLIELEEKMENAQKVYSKIKEEDILGAVLKYRDSIEEIDLQRKTIINPQRISKDKLKVAVIGAGAFAKRFHLPNIKKIKECHLEAVISSTPENARNTAKKFDARISGTDYQSILRDEIDLAIITTRHDTHAQIANDFAKQGINLLVEKPLALNLQDCYELLEIVEKNNVNLAVGFNRRFSPLSQIIKNVLKNRSSPIIMNYLINSASMTKDHWINDPIKGGGAILGEACHFYDYCNWLINSEPRSISAKMISSKNRGLIDTNNISSIIKYEDGSIATITYLTIGSTEYPKERIEIFNENKVVTINDFKSINFIGSKEKDVQLSSINKGHWELLKAYTEFLKGERDSEDLPLIYDGIKATKCAIQILEKAKNG